ncbi:PACE efflux transporter [Vibrio sp. SM6]|uniref:PACE efflux transporter n=1 Tax=Vibrio agarilyticus TaxID=2726741 RepID=A0A7X8TNM1_9VIBR|nr:PACE efflux transporter [Vibrio agarilyticus]NLS11834.1 PACE efflux transporter [Vibrio agarilyticus]
MTRKERIFHMVLFEVIALAILTIAAMIITGKDPLSMSGLAITLSLIAMVWNYAYNLLFDRWHPGDRLKRTKRIRLLHGIGFELGMIALSFPVIMWMTGFGFFHVLIMDMGFVAFFFTYAIIYNWVYDIVRQRFVPSK